MDRLEQYGPERENLLALLHERQNNNEMNYIPAGDMREIAEYLNIPLSSVLGVVTYYSMFSATPRGRHIIRVCDSPVCDMKGSGPLIEALETVLKIRVGETTEDGRFTLETTECLGRCAVAPSVMIDEETYGGVAATTLEPILERYT